jgi:ribosomal protection tetracycline resistance protein
MRCLNLGILAHVDAGKTSLTERLLFSAGVIDTVGSVDAGDTQTDTLALERARGITIRAAVVSFRIGEVTVNLIDTPGHPDFIAEVDRILSLLDGAVLVISAVEGVQPQTRVLLNALKRLGVPTLLFINKIDRAGAQTDELLGKIAETLTPDILAMGAVDEAGRRIAAFTPYPDDDPSFAARLADRLAEHDDALLALLLDGAAPGGLQLKTALAEQVRRGWLHPVYFGSAITGAGIEPLKAAIAELLPSAEGDEAAPLSATLFKIDRGPAGERIGFARVYAGQLRLRDRLEIGETERRVTRIEVFDDGHSRQVEALPAGRIGKIWGLGEIRIGDALGQAPPLVQHHFAAPTLETVVRAARPSEGSRLFAALSQMAEQDPLIGLRQDDVRGELYVSLYGEVQKEVIGDTLAGDFGLEVQFDETTPICIEQVAGSGEALWEPPYPFIARVGLRIEPAPPGTGVDFRLEVDVGSMPAAFFKAVEDGVRETLHQGLCGWNVPDALVAMTHVIRYRHWAASTPAEHRRLTPLALMQALKRAGTIVCEPIQRFSLTTPERTLGLVLPELGRLEIELEGQSSRGRLTVIEGEIAARLVHGLQQQLPALTEGEGVLECVFSRHRPVRGAPPVRPRTDHNPLNRKEYLQNLARRG